MLVFYSLVFWHKKNFQQAHLQTFTKSMLVFHVKSYKSLFARPRARTHIEIFFINMGQKTNIEIYTSEYQPLTKPQIPKKLTSKKLTWRKLIRAISSADIHSCHAQTNGAVELHLTGSPVQVLSNSVTLNQNHSAPKKVERTSLNLVQYCITVHKKKKSHSLWNGFSF